MATIVHNKKGFVVLSGDRFLHFTDGQRTQYQLPKPIVNKEKEKDEDGQDVTRVETENYVLAAGFSCSGKYFTVADNCKQLHVYRTTPGLELVTTRPVQRRCTALTFTHSETDVIIADRTGDVYRFSLEQPTDEGELLLGHLSMILDVKLTPDDRYILTTDRDEKVRISHYPNAYNIYSYCLFHTEYVSQVLFISKLDCLISGSGDGKLASWTLEGKKLCSTTDVKVISDENSVTRSSNHGDIGESTDVKVISDNTSSKHGDNSENTDGAVAGVKKIVYDDILNLLAVIYYRCRVISFYSLNKDEKDMKLENQSELELSGEPWDIDWSPDQRLWVLQPCETNTVTVYKFCREPNSSKVTITIDESCCKNEVEFLNSDWDFFKGSLDIQMHTLSLNKNTKDNMKEYLERKKERIKGGKKKQDKTATGSPTCETPEKRIKTS